MSVCLRLVGPDLNKKNETHKQNDVQISNLSKEELSNRLFTAWYSDPYIVQKGFIITIFGKIVFLGETPFLTDLFVTLSTQIDSNSYSLLRGLTW